MNSGEINFFNSDIEFELPNSDLIRNKLLDYININKRQCSTINYIFCSDEYLLDLNKNYLNHDYYTDILSFQMDNDPIGGDIFISIDRIKDNANELDIPFEEEILRVIAHGMLHFLGYKDKTKAQMIEMRNKENELIHFFNS